ncbi:hypothetical protein Q8G47_28500, partial [Klebsiella pneumoniae]|uniref:hypothetical protein n=1 Tax=Klebsiella pneumoniae TaxID=573 RepID=UPI0030132A12
LNPLISLTSASLNIIEPPPPLSLAATPFSILKTPEKYKGEDEEISTSTHRRGVARERSGGRENVEKDESLRERRVGEREREIKGWGSGVLG